MNVRKPLGDARNGGATRLARCLLRLFKDGKALPVISNQKMNDYLNALCELAEIDEPVRETYKGNERINEITPNLQ